MAGAGAAAAGFAAESGDAFAGDDGDHDETGDGIGPPPADRGVEEKSGEKDGGEVAAKLSLLGVGGHGGAVEAKGDGAFAAGEHGHDDERAAGEDDAGDGSIRRLAGIEFRGSFVADVGCEEEEGPADELEGSPFKILATMVLIGFEAPEHDGAGEAFDDGVDAEADEGDAAGERAGDE